MAKRSCIIAETPFPIYGISMIGDRHFLLAGGGGASKTGIPNAILVFYMDLDGTGQFRAIKTLSLETGSSATMNLDVHFKPPNLKDKNGFGRFYLATGQDRDCKLYALEYAVVDILNGQMTDKVPISRKDSSHHANKPRRRSTSKKESPQHSATGQHASLERNESDAAREALLAAAGDNVVHAEEDYFKCLTFRAEELNAFPTDFHPKGAFQKVVRFSPDGKTVLTGGCDGHFRLWNVETGKKILDHNAHKDDIDDVAFSADGKYFATVGRDSKCFVWTVAGASKYSEVKLPASGGSADKLRYKTLKFASYGRAAAIFYTAANPVSRGGRRQRSLVTQWALVPKETHAIRSNVLRQEEVSSMAVNDTGKLLALGTMNGSVHVWDGVELRPLCTFHEVHSIFVTGLQFLPPPPADDVTKIACFYVSHMCGIVSIAADNTARLNSVPFRRPTPFLLKLAMYSLLVLVISMLVYSAF